MAAGSTARSASSTGWSSPAPLPAIRLDGIDVVAWADEEGHYGNISAAAPSPTRSPKMRSTRPAAATTGRRCARRWNAGFAGRPRERVDPSRYVGYLEAHIEQGDTLDTGGLRIGVVETIVGIWNYRVVLIGEQNHAGTTRMVRRRDAGVAMVRLATRIHDRFPEVAGPADRVDDRAHAARAERALGRPRPCRDAGSVPRRRHRPAGGLRENAAGVGQRDRPGRALAPAKSKRSRAPSRVRWIPASRSRSRRRPNGMRPGKHMRMPSAAGHDAAVLSYRMPSGMMFIPSLRGISHHWSEDTKEEDIVLGAQVFADAAERILHSAR